jgi:aminopeptidase YwaD
MIKKIQFLIFVLYASIGSAQDMGRVKQYLDTLCSPNMHGRGYVCKGDKIAADYLKNQFESIGLQNYKGSFIQNFNFDINTFPGTVFLKADKRKLITGQDYLVNPISKKGKGSSKVKYLDTLIFSNQEAQKKFLAAKNKKFAFVYEAKDYSRITELSLDYLDKIHESKCIIELEDRKLVHGLSNHQFSNPFFKVKKEAFSKDIKKVKFKVDALLIKNYQSQNVIGFVKGKTKGDSIIIISAHYDHLGRMGKEVYFPGANDNASGISLMLELARFYSLPANQPEYSIFFMAFGAEEAGLLGSKYFTEHPYFSLKRIRFMINLDLMGTGDDGMMVVNGTLIPNEFNKLTEINKAHNYLAAIKKRGSAANSDHFFFSEKEVPAFFFYTLGGISAYHDIYDRPETLPLTKFKEVYQLIIDFVKEF